MSTVIDEQRPIVDAFARIVADVTKAPTQAAAERLQAVTAAALRAQLRHSPSIEALAPGLTHLHQVVPERVRTDLLQEIAKLDATGNLTNQALVIARRDEREMLLSGHPANQLTGLAPGERLGPFATQGGIDVWFDVFFAASQIQIKEIGSSTPALVFTQARPSVIKRSTTTIAIEAGTVWVRGDLVASGLPADAFIGVKVAGGSLKLNRRTTVAGAVVEIAAPLIGVLHLNLAADDVTPIDEACSSSQVMVTLPDSITISFESRSSRAKGAAGTAQVWGQQFDFAPSIGAWSFIEPLWTVVLEYDINSRQFDADPIGNDLVQFQGVGTVNRAGLGFPVVAAANPAILGEVAHAAGWLLLVQGLAARWYIPDPRPHELAETWVGISAFGATIMAEGVAPLLPSVTHTYDLWTIDGGSDKRLPWRQTYKEPFSLFYRCHVVEGEYFMVRGQADVALDRPVTTNGAPVLTPTRQGTVLLHQFDGMITAMLGATIEDEPIMHQFALRNALVWTSTPSFVYARGELLDAQRIDAGDAQLLLGVYAWAPTLPDPYVANAFIHRPLWHGSPHSLLLVRLSWNIPGKVIVSFEGQLGPNLALGGRDASSGEPQPARKGNGEPEVGLTQVEQHRLTFDQKTANEWRAAQHAEMQDRGRRFETAIHENEKSLAMIDGYMAEVVGPVPKLLLLDVSTNQDLLGVAVGGRLLNDANAGAMLASGDFSVADLAVHSQVADMRVVALPQVQWEPVRTLDADQNIMTMGWFPTPLASATDGGTTQIGARSQKLMPIIPEDVLQGTFAAYQEGVPVGIRTTFPFGLIAALQLQPHDTTLRKADRYTLNRPKFPDEQSLGGIQVTAQAEGGRPDNGSISPMFEGQMRQLLNGVDLPSGTPLGISVLGETLSPADSVETVFNNDMAANPRVPVTRIDLSGYGGSNFSDWNNPFAAFAEAAKVQFRFMIGRTALEAIKVNSVLHPWGVRVTRSVTIERRPGGGVIRRDSGWQAFTPGIFDYRYFDPDLGRIDVAPYRFDAGVFRGLFNVRTIRPAPGTVFSHGPAKLVPYYFDADVALEGVPVRTTALGTLGYLQTAPDGLPASADALRALIETQGPIGGPIDAWLNFGGSGLPFRVQRVEVGLAMDGVSPIFVATVRGVPSLPTTGAWSVVVRPVASVPPNGGEAVPVAEKRGVPVIRRYPVEYPANDTVFNEPPLAGIPGDYRFADAADLLTPAAPANDYAFLQSTPTHAFLFPRPFVPATSGPRILSGFKPALADVLARTTSKGAFPPPANTIEVGGRLHFDVTPSGSLALSAPVTIAGHPTPLRLGGSSGHGSVLFYDHATLNLAINSDSWSAEFTGLRIWADIGGMERLSGSEMRITGSTNQRAQIAQIRSLILQEVEEMLNFMPFVGDRGAEGPIDLGGTNAKHELKLKHGFKVKIPNSIVPSPLKLYLTLNQALGIDLSSGKLKMAYGLGAALEGRIPIISVGVASAFLVLGLEVEFSMVTASSSVKDEKLVLSAFAGLGVQGQIGPFAAYAFLAIGFAMDVVFTPPPAKGKYGGMVLLEAGINLMVVAIKVRADLRGLVYKDASVTKCDFTGSVKVQVDLFVILSISATYQVSDTATFS
jgi:hypothetical protein